MALTFIPLSLPESVNINKFQEFGLEVKGFNPNALTPETFAQIEKALYKHDLLLFRGIDLTPQQQYALVKAFDPSSESYGHGNKTLDESKSNIIHGYLRSLPKSPQVQIIGHGVVRDHEGIKEITLKHGHHRDFHKTKVPCEDEAKGYTRYFRWHMDAALYDLDPPRVTALYGLQVPRGPLQTVRYDDGTGDELSVTLGTTAFVSGKIMFEILSRDLKSFAVRAKAQYAPHPFVWMRNAKAKPTGLGLETEGAELLVQELPPWVEHNVKTYPFLWKNPVTGDLHLQVHPCAIKEILVDPLPDLANETEGSLYPKGGRLTDLKEIRDLIYKLQRPGIAPELVYPHPWEEKDLVLFNNRGVMHSVVGVFQEGQIRLFHQCNLASSDEPSGPNEDDLRKWA